jgi:CRISPR-associated protein Cas2
MKRATKIFCIVAYDVEDNRQRDKIAKLLEKYGIRINLSVFECMFTDTQ